MRTKIFAAALAVVFLLSMGACGRKEKVPEEQMGYEPEHTAQITEFPGNDAFDGGGAGGVETAVPEYTPDPNDEEQRGGTEKAKKRISDSVRKFVDDVENKINDSAKP